MLGYSWHRIKTVFWEKCWRRMIEYVYGDGEHLIACNMRTQIPPLYSLAHLSWDGGLALQGKWMLSGGRRSLSLQQEVHCLVWYPGRTRDIGSGSPDTLGVRSTKEETESCWQEVLLFKKKICDWLEKRKNWWTLMKTLLAFCWHVRTLFQRESLKRVRNWFWLLEDVESQQERRHRVRLWNTAAGLCSEPLWDKSGLRFYAINGSRINAKSFS